MSWVFDAQDWTVASSPGTTDDIPAAVLALERGEYQPALTQLEFACMRGDGLYPIAVPVVRCLVDSLSRCPPETQIMIIDFVSLLASRGDQTEAPGTAAVCARETLYAFTTYVHLLENAQGDGDRQTCVDMLGICALADPTLRPRVVALFEQVLRERTDAASRELRVLVANTLEWIRGLSLSAGFLRPLDMSTPEGTMAGAASGHPMVCRANQRWSRLRLDVRLPSPDARPHLVLRSPPLSLRPRRPRRRRGPRSAGSRGERGRPTP